jgi:hypothetical protein
MQTNGALTIQDMNNNNLWISKLNGASNVGGYRLLLQADGNLVICDANNIPYWALNGGTANYLINYWPMNNLSDIIGGANLYGGSSYSFVSDRLCSPNAAIYFNQGYLEVPSGVYFSGDFTVTAWIYLKSYQFQSKIFDFGNGPHSNNVGLSMFERTSQMFGFTVSFIITQPIINLNQWHFVAFVISGTTSYIYVNGSQLANGTLQAPNNIIRSTNYIGKSSWSTDLNADAIYDDMKIFKGALSPSDIINEYSIISNNINACTPTTTTTTTTSTTPSTTTTSTTKKSVVSMYSCKLLSINFKKSNQISLSLKTYSNFLKFSFLLLM